jgi:carbonic anhydrase/acetyltransferase-like protein (isoleucine patch superfamily)
MIYKLDDHMPKIDPSIFLAPNAIVIGKVTIGKNSTIWFNAVLRADINEISIGEHTNIQDFCMCHVPSHLALTVGNYVTTGHNVILHGCTIGNKCLIGMGSVVMDGAKVGDNTIIGAGSLVTEGMELPSGVLAFGSPAKVRRELTSDELAIIMQSAEHYSRLGQRYVKNGINGLIL